ncbi:hypothetical protein BDV12DRAFT_109569 [Aspergillus spectabilis]
MNPSTLQALTTLATLTSSQKRALVDRIAQEMASTMLTISRELHRGTLQAEHTEPIYAFIRTIQHHELATRRKLERKLDRCERREREWRAERRWIRREFVGIRRRMEVLRRGWNERVILRRGGWQGVGFESWDRSQDECQDECQHGILDGHQGQDQMLEQGENIDSGFSG